MTDPIKVLIIDDHQAVIEGYKSILSYPAFADFNFQITSALNCESAYNTICHPLASFNLVLLDIILPPFEEQKIFSGQDLASLIKTKLPDAKIIILSSHTEAFELYNILQTTKPNAFIAKSDFTPQEFITAFNKIMIGEIYHSNLAKQSLKEFQNKDDSLDAYSRRIISLLNKGIATKNIPSHLNLSISAVDKRKSQIKTFFNIEKGNDEDIIREARKRGFIQ